MHMRKCHVCTVLIMSLCINIYTAFDDIAYLINLFEDHYNFYVNCDLYPDISESFASPKNVPTFLS